jgi:hypothetical protein
MTVFAPSKLVRNLHDRIRALEIREESNRKETPANAKRHLEICYVKEQVDDMIKLMERAMYLLVWTGFLGK